MVDLVAALLPCAWGYVHVARELAKAEPPKDQRYADWIDQYASDDFVDAAQWLRDELDRLSEGATAEKKAKLTDLFVVSSRYEWQFWEMCYHGEQWPV